MAFKVKPADFLDSLVTGRDRLALAEKTKEILESQGFSVVMRIRNYKSGPRIYLKVAVLSNKWISDPAKNAVVVWSVQHNFPDGRITSASDEHITWALW